MNLETIQHQNLILLSALSGSHAYGLNHAHSDVDIRGVFIAPQAKLYGFTFPTQISDDKNDTTYYELGRFIELLCKNNPNILELLAVSDDVIQVKHPLMNELKPSLFLSKLCKNTFAGYAREQIRKAWGLNKKIMNPIDGERKSILDFCYIVSGHGSKALSEWLSEKGWNQEDCGLVNIPNMQNLYALFHKSQFTENPDFRGIILDEKSQHVRLSSIPNGVEAAAILSYNLNGYSVYCKQYANYWSWVADRNQNRYESTIEHGKLYDAKNMMHTFRLLHMAEEIAREGQIIVRRTTDKAFLLKIRQGIFFYQDLVDQAEVKLNEIEQLFDKSSLQESPDEQYIESILVDMRKSFYH
jgi:uncharacterized protein